MPIPTVTRPPRNGHTPPARRWILSAPVPLPDLGDYGDLIAVYDLDKAMAFPGWAMIAHDLIQEDRALERQRVHLLTDLRERWPDAQREADPDGYGADDYAVAQQIRVINEQKRAINRQMNVRALADFLIDVRSADAVEVADPTDPAAWEGWSDHILDWLTSSIEGQGLWQAREQLIGKKAPPASVTPSR